MAATVYLPDNISKNLSDGLEKQLQYNTRLNTTGTSYWHRAQHSSAAQGCFGEHNSLNGLLDFSSADLLSLVSNHIMRYQ